jgi:hypothetical protein
MHNLGKEQRDLGGWRRRHWSFRIDVTSGGIAL